MRKVQCGECGRIYDFDQDEFCPKCGAFNQPPRSTRINAQGEVIEGIPSPVVRREGINERNHKGSFVHKEYHTENRKRRGTSLSQGGRSISWEKRSGKKKPLGVGTVLWWAFIGIWLLNFLVSLFLRI